MFGKGKIRSLDAICAKLKSASENDVENGCHSESNLPIRELQDNEQKPESSENNNACRKEVLDNCIPCDQEKVETVRSKLQSTHYNSGSQGKAAISNRRKRKGATPRNILEVREKFDKIDEKDELAEYEINNQNTTFPPEEEDELNSSNNSTESGKENHCTVNSSTSVCNEPTDCATSKNDGSRDSPSNSATTPADPATTCPPESPVTNSIHDSLQPTDRKRKPRKPVPSNNGRGSPLDLSTSSTKTSYQSSITDDDCKDDVGESTAKSENMTIDENEKAEEKKNEKLELDSLMDYAEHTMNELLSIYGLSGSAETASKQVPNKGLSSNHIMNGQGQTVVHSGLQLSATPASSTPSSSGNVSPLSTPSSAEKKGIHTNFLTSNGSRLKGQSSEGLKDDKFINSAAYIKAVFNKQSGDTTPIKSGSLPDYSKYLKRFMSGTECKVKFCKDLGYREHFHCMDCNFRVFVKKEEMVRHFKWHRKREDSLQHGFMRYSPMDDCSGKFGSCTHNGRQTHYHCLQMGCDKVYISTSDVQMHANYHRKDSAIIQEGFQRFRATEDCGTQTCAFYGQRTTHFHCRRPGCNFTFKNKADMEKHKTYHQKDEVLARDGFKKFMKYEHCGYLGCRYSKLSNHIHCIRPGCLYVLHSTAQLFSHKRKHERRDFETAYKKYREENSEGSWMMSHPPGLGLVNPSLSSQDSMSLPVSIKSESGLEDESSNSRFLDENSNSDIRSIASENSESVLPDLDSSSCNGDVSMSDMSMLSHNKSKLEGEKLNDSLTLPIPMYSNGGYQSREKTENTKTEAADLEKLDNSENVTSKGMSAPQVKTSDFTGQNEALQLQLSSPAHAQSQPTSYFLSSPTATTLPLPARPPPVNLEKRERDESWKNYLLRFTANDPCNSRCQYLYKDHYHCRVEGCLVLFKSKDGVREHARFHEMQDRITPVAYTTYDEKTACPQNCQYSNKEKHYHCIWSGCTHVVPHHGPTFGRLEHYRIHEDARASIGKTYKYATRSDQDTPRRRGRPPKYPKNEIPVIPKVELSEKEIEKSIEGTVDPSVINGFKKFEENEPCPDELCIYRMKQHYHCARPRCHQATDRLDVLNLHAKDFHNFVTILEGFEFFDRNINCRRLHCHNNKANRHFHCVRPKCDYSFVRHSTMLQHNKRHEGSTEQESRTQTSIKTTPKDTSIKKEAVSTPTSALIPVISTADGKGMIKTSGIYYPLSGLSGSQPGCPLVAAVPATSLSPSQKVAIPMVSSPTLSPMIGSSAMVNPVLGAGGVLSSVTPLLSAPGQLPLAVLLQQGANAFPQPSWLELRTKMHYVQNEHCGRPFCKLKKKDHYHCYECNQAFSDESRIRSHVGKHGIKFNKFENVPNLNLLYSTGAPQVAIAPKVQAPPTEEKGEDPELSALSVMSDGNNSSDEDELNASDSLNLNPSTFSNMIAKAQKAHAGQGLEKGLDADDSLDGKLVIHETDNSLAESETGTDVSQDGSAAGTEAKADLSKHSGRKRTRTKHFDFIDSNIVIKQRRTSTGAITTNPKSPKNKVTTASGGIRGTRDDTIPEGYIKVRHKDQCTYSKCAYHQGVTHFHCTRSDCGYSFSDRSRLIQHTLRHERIDSLTGGEMQQYRMKQDCERGDCEYQGKASHFHCLKCNYCCTDSSKVLTHRKYHAKLENINSQGFEKYSTSESCAVEGCQYEMKQTHYHCTKPGCHYAVLGPAQMASHNIKHANDSL